MTTSIPLRIYLNTILSPAAEKPAQKKLRIWGDFVGRPTKIFNYIIPQKPATYKGFWAGGYPIATMISSQSRYDHFDTSPYLSQHQHLRKWGELMGRTKKNIKLKIPEKPRKIKGFQSRSYRKATTISSQSRYDHFDTSPYYDVRKTLNAYCTSLMRNLQAQNVGKMI
ncbi:MAG: hypothetical protein SO122_03520 [Eubacteriales bacterium]|nr:hypothetical protein [Eubacteriales bacterium]